MQVQHFFEHYKDREPGKWVKCIGWGDANEARQMVAAGLLRAKVAEGVELPETAEADSAVAAGRAAA